MNFWNLPVPRGDTRAIERDFLQGHGVTEQRGNGFRFKLNCLDYILGILSCEGIESLALLAQRNRE